MRHLSPIAIAGLVAVVLAGCGGSNDRPKAALGSPQNPVVARPQGASPSSGTAAARRAARALNEANAAAAAGEGEATAVAGATPGSSKTTAKGDSSKGATKSDRSPGAAAAEAAAGEPATTSRPNAAPSYAGILKQRDSSRGASFSPCNLVSQNRAEAILGSGIRTPLEAPQGPTCIYRTTNNKYFVTVSVQQARYASVRKQVHKPTATSVGGHTAYCGTLGQPMLYVPLSGTRLLTITGGPCNVAKAFAATAVQKLT
jgi:hypothetical protein